MVKSGEQLTFKVNVKNSYTQSKTVKLKLLIDDKVVGSVSGSIAGNSEKSFTLHWLAQEGEHSYQVKLYNLIGEQEFNEDNSEGSVIVTSPTQQFAVSLNAFPEELESGGTVYLTVHVKNFENAALSLSGFVENGNGTVIKKIGGFEGRIPANGGKNITFTYMLYGVGNHTFKLFLDNGRV